MVGARHRREGERPRDEQDGRDRQTTRLWLLPEALFHKAPRLSVLTGRASTSRERAHVGWRVSWSKPTRNRRQPGNRVSSQLFRETLRVLILCPRSGAPPSAAARQLS